VAGGRSSIAGSEDDRFAELLTRLGSTHEGLGDGLAQLLLELCATRVEVGTVI